MASEFYSGQLIFVFALRASGQKGKVTPLIKDVIQGFCNISKTS
jgi:hypothetical protein